MAKPGQMSHWVTLAAACFVNRNYAGVLTSVESMLSFQREDSAKSHMKGHEASEVALLGVRAHIAQGSYQKALEYLQNNRKIIVD